jgi:hypothetical protein
MCEYPVGDATSIPTVAISFRKLAERYRDPGSGVVGTVGREPYAPLDVQTIERNCETRVSSWCELRKRLGEPEMRKKRSIFVWTDQSSTVSCWFSQNLLSICQEYSQRRSSPKRIFLGFEAHYAALHPDVPRVMISLGLVTPILPNGEASAWRTQSQELSRPALPSVQVRDPLLSPPSPTGMENCIATIDLADVDIPCTATKKEE